jgi:uncharacterized protein YciI
MSSDAAGKLLAGMLNKVLYVALRTPRDTSRLGELLESHLRWAIAAERRGELFASGPFVADDIAPGSIGGMSILRAASEEEARAILAADPFVAEGAYSVDVRRWLLMEGSLTLNVHLSDQSSRLF